MSRTTLIGLLSAFNLSLVAAQGASTSYTPAAGYFSLTIKGQSDSQLSMPLAEKAAAFGKITAVSQETVTVRAKNWSVGAFRYVSGTQDTTYYAEFASGVLKGIRYRILDNSDDTLLLETQGDDFTAHPVGTVAYDDVVRIRPMWTIGTLLGTTETDVVIDPKADPLAPGDSVLVLDNQRVGQNKAPVAEIAYVHNLGWRATGDATTDQGHWPFETGQPLVVRRLSADSVSFVVLGHVLTGAQSMFVFGGNSTSANDAYVSILYPESITLGSAGLYTPTDPAGSVIKSSRSKLLRNDELLAYGSRAGFNLASERSFFYLENVGWREVGSAKTTVGSDFLLEPGKAYIIRKKTGNFGADWLQGSGN